MNTTEQIAAVRRDLQDAQTAATDLANRVSDSQWSTRPKSGGWSAAECIAHLTMTTAGYLPLMNAGIAKVPANSAKPATYKREFGARMLEWVLKPPYRVKTKTLPAFIPEAAAPKAEIVAAFVTSQKDLLAWITSADRVPLNLVMITSPFSERLTYNAYAALRVLAMHQRRHLWQAERATRGLP